MYKLLGWIIFCGFILLAGQFVKDVPTYSEKPEKKTHTLNAHDLETIELLAIRAKNDERRRLRRIELLRNGSY